MSDDVATDERPETELAATETEPEKERLEMSVDLTDVGPCKKHVKVSIPQSEIDKFLNREFSDLVKNANVAGFRPGKAPRKLIERRFRKEVADKVKGAILMQSLEQIGEDEKLDPLSEPDIDVQSIELPESGDFIYEFDVEVRPEFALPEYKNLRIKRPSKEFSERDIEVSLTELLRRSGELRTKEAPAEKGDYVQCDVRFLDGGNVVREFEDLTLKLDEELTFRDGLIKDFLKGMAGAEEGETREFKVKLSDSAAREEMAGKEIDAVFVVKEVKELIPASLDAAFLESVGAADVGELKDMVRHRLERRLERAQRQSTTEQVMDKIVEHADWELPQDLLRRQAERSLQRALIDLQEAGYSEEEIRARLNILRQNSIHSTAKSLKQQFVLQAIAEAENIKIEEEDVEEEIEAMAARAGESVRRFRARVEKEGWWDAIGMQVLERKTIDKIVSYSTVEDVPWVEEELSSSAVDAAAVPEPAPAPPTPEEVEAARQD